MPRRIRRFFTHFSSITDTPFGWWLLETFILLGDIAGAGEIYDIAGAWIKWNTRALTPAEVALAKNIFGTQLPYHRIRLDERAYLGPKQKHICYVSFCTINSWGPMTPHIFLHELTHIWQYLQMGAVYIPRALRAQRTKEGYNYGGVAALKHNDCLLDHFNLEQQADIIADYYLLQQGKRPQWGDGNAFDLPHYHRLLEKLGKA